MSKCKHKPMMIENLFFPCKEESLFSFSNSHFFNVYFYLSDFIRSNLQHVGSLSVACKLLGTLSCGMWDLVL